MKLDNRNECFKDQYRCALTIELDLLSKIAEKEFYAFYYHYVLADGLCKQEKCLAIRVPGGTVGGIWIDDNNVITDIKIDTDYVVKTYPSNVNKLIKKFIGEVIEW